MASPTQTWLATWGQPPKLELLVLSLMLAQTKEPWSDKSSNIGNHSIVFVSNLFLYQFQILANYQGIMMTLTLEQWSPILLRLLCTVSFPTSILGLLTYAARKATESFSSNSKIVKMFSKSIFIFRTKGKFTKICASLQDIVYASSGQIWQAKLRFLGSSL